MRATGGDWAVIRFEILTTLFISVSSFDPLSVKFQALMDCQSHLAFSLQEIVEVAVERKRHHVLALDAN